MHALLTDEQAMRSINLYFRDSGHPRQPERGHVASTRVAIQSYTEWHFVDALTQTRAKRSSSESALVGTASGCRPGIPVSLFRA